MTNTLNDSLSMESRYQRAHSLIKDVWAPKSAFLNTSLYPIWIGNSDCFWYERELKDGKEYRLVDAKTASNQTAFDHDALSAALAEATEQEVDARNLPITQVSMEFDTSSLPTNKAIKTIHFTAFEKSWAFDSETGACTEVETTPDDWVLSPDGKYAAFLRDFNIWVHDISSGEERALTRDGEEEYVYGVAGSAWGSLMGGGVQVLWSADSKRLFTVQRDTRQILTLPVVHHVPKDGSVRPTIDYVKVAYPGDEHIETLRLLSIEVETGRIQDANYRHIPTTRNSYGFFYSNLGWWSTDSRRAYFVDVERDYKTVRVVEFDTNSGDTKVLFTETSKTQINLMLNSDELPTFMPLPDSSELLWFSERSGWAHLYLYDLETGNLKNTVTQGDWLVRQITYFEPKRREVFIQTAGRVSDRDPYYRDLCRVHLDTGELTTLVSSDHEIIAVAQKDMNIFAARVLMGHDIGESNSVSPTGEFAVVTQSRADEIPVSYLIDRNGKNILELETADVSALPDNWQWPEPVRTMSADGHTDLYGLIFKPSNFNPNQRYPVVSHVFNSPELPWVAKGSFSNGIFCNYSYLDAAAVAELGFIVIQIDGRGTPFRHKDFHDENYGRVETSSNLGDHVTSLQQLAKCYSYMDLNRVGIVSNAGPGGLQGLLQYPDFYKVGISNILHDCRLMPASMWGEKFEGLSGPNSDYQYPEQQVDNLKGKLLLINGMLDFCNPPAGIFRIVDALQKANKDFDLILLPNVGHDMPVSYMTRRAWDYLVKNLMDIEPPKEYKLTTICDVWNGEA